MVSVYIVPLVAQVVVPVALLVWHWVARDSNGAAALLRTLFVGAYLATIALAGLWLIVPWSLSIVYLMILAAGTRTRRQCRAAAWWPRTRLAWVGLAATGTLTVASVALAAHTLSGRWPAKEQIVDLEFPLRGGTYYVVNGGSHDLINAHLQTLTAVRFHDYRGQSYGVDIVALNSLGLRASGLVPRDPRRYVIFGDAIYAPCSGGVFRAEDGRPDMSPPASDREHLAGNFVLLDCAGVHVLLAHMQQDSVRAWPGHRVTAGDVVGRVGNSGNSNEPHLHIHVQRPATSDADLSGDPLPLRLDGRFLVRNDRVTHTAGAER